MRLLVVEDDKNLREQLASALGDAGYTVDTADNGEDGQFLGETEPYDLAILDLGLPKVDGLSVLKAWRKEGRTMPVLILSARDRWSEKVEGLDLGANDYVTKRRRQLLPQVLVVLDHQQPHTRLSLSGGVHAEVAHLAVRHSPTQHINWPAAVLKASRDQLTAILGADFIDDFAQGANILLAAAALLHRHDHLRLHELRMLGAYGRSDGAGRDERG